MIRRLIITTFLAVLSYGAVAQDTDIIYVHHQGRWLAVDIRNIDTIAFDSKLLNINSRGNICRIPFDSVVFAPPAQPVMPIGWWGDICHGPSKGYYHTDCSPLADVEMDACDSLCQSLVLLYDISTTEDSHLSPRKVGRKWRYTKSTLTRRRKFSLSSSSYLPYGKSQEKQTDGAPDARYRQSDLSSLLNNHRADEVCQVLNIWYQPEEDLPVPPQPVFGTFHNDTYHLTLEDNIRISIHLQRQDATTVTADSMMIAFNSEEDARREFIQMDTSDDENTQFTLAGNAIIIIEHFNATYQEVMTWLTRFDIDLCRPLFIREE